jgi:hypothetical protein
MEVFARPSGDGTLLRVSRRHPLLISPQRIRLTVHAWFPVLDYEMMPVSVRVDTLESENTRLRTENRWLRQKLNCS